MMCNFFHLLVKWSDYMYVLTYKQYIWQKNYAVYKNVAEVWNT